MSIIKVFIKSLPEGLAPTGPYGLASFNYRYTSFFISPNKYTKEFVIQVIVNYFSDLINNENNGYIFKNGLKTLLEEFLLNIGDPDFSLSLLPDFDKNLTAAEFRVLCQQFRRYYKATPEWVLITKPETNVNKIFQDEMRFLKNLKLSHELGELYLRRWN